MEYEADVNMGTEKALVEYDPSKLKLAELENAVKEAGYGVVNENVVLKVGGMSCVMCVKAVENVLGKIEGINNVTVNLISEGLM
jgi:Cu+-exporting ATPase